MGDVFAGEDGEVTVTGFFGLKGGSDSFDGVSYGISGGNFDINLLDLEIGANFGEEVGVDDHGVI